MAVAEEVAHEREYVDAIRAEALAEQRPPPARAEFDALTEDTHRRDAETKTGDQWAPGSPGIVTAGVRSETFTVDVKGASEFVVAVKTITTGVRS